MVLYNLKKKVKGLKPFCLLQTSLKFNVKIRDVLNKLILPVQLKILSF